MATTYLSRTFASGNQKTWTLSGWFKFADGTSNMQMFGFSTAANNASTLDFVRDTTGSIRVDHWTEYKLVTNRKFRDVSGWYHLVLRVDTTLATADDRIRLYVNGVQETSFSTRNNPSQDEDFIINSNTAHFIGVRSHSGSLSGLYFDGSMSHLHFCDGYSYGADSFGSTDSTTGEWKINTSPSVTYGTTGFFILKDGNSVTDQSGNSNNWTVTAGTLTNTEDCPDNVFATWNPLVYNANPPIYKSGNTEEEGQSDSRYPVTISTLAMPKSGKFYAEFKKVDPSNDYEAVGIADTEKAIEAIRANTDVYVVGYEGAASIKRGGASMTYGSEISGYIPAVGDNDIIQVAFDGDNGAVYFGRNGTWGNSGVPTSGSSKTGAVDISGATWYTDAKDLVFLAGEYSSSGYGHLQANFGNGYFGTTAISSEGTNASGIGKFEYDVPTGYTSLSTKGLNE